jgi:hypothetical protein
MKIRQEALELLHEDSKAEQWNEQAHIFAASFCERS